MWINKREYEYLQRELAFYRAKAETERERADRAADSLIAYLGASPISDNAVKKERDAFAEAKDAFEKQQRQVWEIYSEASEETLSPKEEPEIAGKET